MARASAPLPAMEAEQSSTKQCSRVACGGSRRRCRCSGASAWAPRAASVRGQSQLPVACPPCD
ncbi:hypothetical protein A9976_14125 [Delftia sp. UME58]|nr:hypothetical protein [Delftia sp. UME58]